MNGGRAVAYFSRAMRTDGKGFDSGVESFIELLRGPRVVWVVGVRVTSVRGVHVMHAS